MQKINYYALAAYRNTADKDYIHARMAYKASLFPQFHWSALHALEKYAKCLLVLTRVPRSAQPIKHEVTGSLDLLSSKIDISLSERTLKFVSSLEEYGARFRYFEVSWSIFRGELADLDRAVWELRRHCNAELYVYSGNDFVSVNSSNNEELNLLDKPTVHNTFISGGFIEKVLADKLSVTRSALVWCNLFYSSSKRTRVKLPYPILAENSPLYLYPEIIDELSKFTFIPKEVCKAYKNR